MSNQQGNGNDGRQVSPITEFRNYMTGPMRAEIAKQLPKGIDVDRFIRTAITSVQMNPELLEANRSSLFAAVMQAAKDGLLPDGREATIQIYNTNVAKRGQRDQWVKMAQYMPMVGGLIAKMYEAGCTYVDAAAVYARDEFRFRRGDDPGIEHEPYLGDDDPGKVVAAYAVIKLGTGETKREVMPRRDIEKVRAASKSSDGPGWTKWYDQFAIKAVLKRIYKQLPHTSPALDRIIEHDNEAMGFDSFQQQTPQDVTAITGEGTNAIEHKPGRSSRLDGIIKSSGINAAAQTVAAQPEPEPEIHF
jgi:recombination protein RecT